MPELTNETSDADFFDSIYGERQADEGRTSFLGASEPETEAKGGFDWKGLVASFSDLAGNGAQLVQTLKNPNRSTKPPTVKGLPGDGLSTRQWIMLGIAALLTGGLIYSISRRGK